MIRLCAVLVLASLLLTGCGGQRSQGTPTRALKDTTFVRAWDLSVGHPIEGAWLPSQATDLLLVQLSGTHEVVCIDTFSGHTLWMTPPLQERLRFPPAVGIGQRLTGVAGKAVLDRRVYVVSVDTLLCYEAVGGQLVWRYQLPFAIASGASAVGVDNDLRVMIGDWAGRVQVVGLHPEKKFPFVLWQWNLGAPVTAEPIHHDGVFIAGDLGGGVSAFRHERDQVWHANLGSPVTARVAARGRHVYVGTQGNAFSVLSRLDGTVLASVSLGGPVEQAPFVLDDAPDQVFIWVGGSDPAVAGLRSIRVQGETLPPVGGARFGKEVVRMGANWAVPGVSRLVGSAPDHLFVTDSAGTVVQAVNRRTGATDWRWDAQSERQAEQIELGVAAKDRAKVTSILAYEDPAVLNRTFYVMDDHGGVVAYRFLGPVLPGRSEALAGGGSATPAAGTTAP